VYAHSVPVPVHGFFKKIKGNQKLALFSTHGARTEGRMQKEAIEHAIGLAKNPELLGYFTCRGQVEQAVLDDLMTKPEHRAWAMEAASAHAHPDKADLEDAQVFARGVLKKALKFKDFNKK
ncbi:MAG: flavodoxin family protein, partial [Desulfomonilia bacterium]|nr:flavodoxin family protein [Desulfomonilia bacterium]